MLQVEDLLEPIACEDLIKGVKNEKLWKQLHLLCNITFLRVKRMIKSHIRVEEALVARRSSTQVHRGGISDKTHNRNRSPVRRQKVRKKGPLWEHPSKPERVYTPVNTNYTDIYTTLRGQNLLQYPPPLKPNPNLKFSKKYCQFYRERGHDTEDCNALRKEVERLLA